MSEDKEINKEVNSLHIHKIITSIAEVFDDNEFDAFEVIFACYLAAETYSNALGLPAITKEELQETAIQWYNSGILTKIPKVKP